MINSVIFEGNLVREPEAKFFPNGGKYAIMVLGNSQKFVRQDGSIDENKCFIEVQVFGKSAEVVLNHLGKGCRVTTQGELNLQTWQTKEGEKRSKYIIIAKKLSIITFKQREAENTTNTNSPQIATETIEKYKNAENLPSVNLSVQDNEIPQTIPQTQGGENV